MKPVVVQLPIGKEETFEGVVDLVRMKAYRYDEADAGRPGDRKRDPGSMLGKRRTSGGPSCSNRSVDFSDELMRQMLAEEADRSRRTCQGDTEPACLHRRFIRCSAGRPLRTRGFSSCSMPSSNIFRLRWTGNGEGKGSGKRRRAESRLPDEKEPFSALVFKIASDAHVGRLAYVRVYSGQGGFKDHFLNPRTRRERAGYPDFPDARQQTACRNRACSPVKYTAWSGLRRPRPAIPSAIPIFRSCTSGWSFRSRCFPVDRAEEHG